MSEWYDIPGYGGMYQVNKQGDVRSWRMRFSRKKAKTPFMMTPIFHKGYYVVPLRSSGEKPKEIVIARIMAEVFMGGIPDGYVVYHKNGDLLENALFNLEIIPRSEMGRRSRGKRKPVVKIDQHGNDLDIYSSVEEAARKNFLSPTSVISRCKKR